MCEGKNTPLPQVFKGGIMKVSAITAISSEENRSRRNYFIQFSNNFMSAPEVKNPIEKAQAANKKMGIENLEEFTIFPKEKVNGRTVITA